MSKYHTYIDLFAGCGGLSLGLHNAGWKGLFAIEKSPDAFKTLEYNLIHKLNHFNWPKWLPKEPLNINTVLKKYRTELEKLQGKVDLIAGGPPCQGFSTAGKRNESDARNQLIHSYIEFIEIVKPKLIFFENVKGFTMEFEQNKTKGNKYSSFVIEKLEDAGYDVYSKMVNFSEYGVPQKRCRFILVGVRHDISLKNKVYATAFFENIQKNREKFLINKGLSINANLEEAISDLLMKHGTAISPDTKRFKAGLYAEPESKYQKYLRNGIRNGNIADSHRFVNHTKKVAERNAFILEHTRKGVSINDELKEKYKLKKRTIVPLDKKTACPTITTLTDDLIHYLEPRVLTVREYARIQSFPDTFEFKKKYTTGGKLRSKEVPRYTQVANAVPPLFGEQSGIILKRLI